MINTIISFSIRNKFIIGLFTLALIGVGIYSMRTINLGSVPDITNNQVQVMTVSPNLATEDIEQFVTYPVEMAMGNLPGVNEIRSISRFGLSVVTVVFDDDMGIYKPRQLVQEKLSEVQDKIPEQFGNPSMGPITTGLGEIYQYTITPMPGYDTAYTTTELRTIQDWVVRRQLTLVDGVVGVNAFGGAIKQYEIAVNPEKLNASNVTISEVFTALERNNVNTGGAYIERNKMANFIRGEGLIRSLEDIRQIVIKTTNGLPIMIGDVAEKVHYGNQVRYGAFTQDGREAVGGMVLMLKDANPNKVIQNVQQRMKVIQTSLPEGLEIKPFLDRSDLIDRTTGTVKKNLMEGALIVIFALVFLLGSLRGGIITATTIPLSLLFAFIMMKQFNVWANLMSLGAIDFGIIIDGAVIVIEGTVFEIQKRIKDGQKNFNQGKMDQVAYEAGSTMMGSAFFGQIIILIVFAPILFLTGIEGKMFQPMAYTFGFAMIGAILLCLTYVPMMAALFMKPVGPTLPSSRFLRTGKRWYSSLERGLEKISHRIIHGVQWFYQPLIKGALRFKAVVILAAILLLGTALFTFSRLGGEFIPQLDEGDIAMQALIRPGSGLTESIEVSKKIESLLLQHFPEVKTAVARIGVADIPTDPMPMDISDMFIILEKDQSKWTSAASKAELIEKIKSKLNEELVGVNLVFSQPVELRFNELLTGVREDVAVKLYGDDLEILARKAEEMAGIIRTVPGVGDVSAERTSGLPQMTVQYDRKKMAQYGLDIAKVNDYINTAFAGGQAGVIFEGEKRFDLVVRFDTNHRKNIDDLRNMYIDLENGTQIPIKEVAEISYVPGPMQISRDNTFRRTNVGVNTRGRDVESVVKDIQSRLNEELELPPGYYMTYGGEFENLQRAKSRLSVVVPIALALIFILLYFALHSFSQSVMIYMAIPLAAIGGVFALWVRGMPFSISAGVGFIVLFGVAVLNGLVLVNRFNSLKAEGMTSIRVRILTGTKERIRPIMLTAMTDIFGFLPMAFSTTSGAEVQRPLATVVIGGMLTATFLTLVVLPVLYALIERQREKNKSKSSMKPSLNTLVILGILTTLWSFPRTAHTQTSMSDTLPVLSLEEAQERAVVSYPQIKIRHLRINQEEALKSTAWDLGRTEIFTGQDGAGRGSPGTFNQIGIKQKQIDLFGIKPKKQLAEARITQARDQLDLSKSQLRRNVKMDWAAVYTALKKYEVYHRMDSLFKDVKRAARIRLEVEESSRLSYLATTNQANEIRIRKEQAYQDYLSGLHQLNGWFDSDTLFSVKTPLWNHLTETGLPVRDTLASHPSLTLARQDIEVVSARVETRKAALLPRFQLEYSRQSIDGKSGYNSYEIGVDIPLFSKPERGRIKEAEVEQQMAVENYREVQMKLHARYRSARERYLKWLDSWNYYTSEALPLAREQREGAAIAFQEGAIDYVTFLQNTRDAIRIEIDAWDAFGQLLESKYLLEYYLQTTN
ncbi:CusA/CzcA family heavy metal efflux RND transporter [Membranicola marinus]|uniref:CusA/CzcA family heavy metal efflux RND transporter n=1 Tax=Membranihabitans marinus TaxID=1227546 RepID=A0A953L9T2_9BACT|nr:CusA/CzcA family heavy metal efflux RND transporter [Membranihabitans marinus]MBY5959160.1 CusA/CzcA family heavy metal efflux RND transporter [Membranihabitans marinus]